MKSPSVKKYLALLLVSAFLTTAPLWAQRAPVVDFRQPIDVSLYHGMKFRFSAMAKLKPPSTDNKAWLRVEVEEKGRNGGNLLRKIQSSEWEKYTIGGVIGENVEKLFIGGMVDNDGEVFFDDFRLEIETGPGQWQEIPVLNPGFEKWTNNERPDDWEGTLFEVINYVAKPSLGETVEGQSGLKVMTDGYNVRSEYFPALSMVYPSFEYFTKDQGLPSSEINCLIQDRQGLIWMGTRDGLVRYDGYAFNVYQNDPSDSSSLSANDVMVIYEDRSARLWIGTQSGGLNLFDRKTEQFLRFQHNPEDSLSLSHNTVSTIYEDSEGYIWLGGQFAKGLNRLDPISGNCKQYLYNLKNPFSLQSNWIMDIKEDAGGRLWLATYSSGLVFFDRKKETFYHYFTMEDEEHRYGTKYLLSIYPDKDGTLWLGSENHWLYQFEPEKREFIAAYRIPYRKGAEHLNYIRIINPDPASGLWLLLGDGLSRFDAKTKKFQFFQVAKAFFINMTIDREGIIWMGTDKGICRMNPLKNQFQYQPLTSSLPKELKESVIDGPILADSKDLLWVKTEKGLYQWDLLNSKGEYLKYDHKDSARIKNQLVSTLYEDKNLDVWFGVNYVGLIKWDRNSRRTEVIGPKGDKNVREINSITEDRKDTLWLGSWMGLYQFDRNNETYSGIPRRPADKNGRSWTRISAVFEDNKGILWIGTTFGEFLQFDRQTRLFHDFTPKGVNIEIDFGENLISCIHEDNTGRLWFGTSSNGLWGFDQATQNYSHFTQKDGLINNRISGILEDSRGRLWISTKGGLSRFDPNTNRFRNYTVHDGLPSNELGDFQKGKSTDAFFLGTAKGIVVFHPDSIKDNPLMPPMVITSLKTYNAKGEPISVPGISDKKEVTFSYKYDILTIEFAALSFAKSEKNEYAYKLDGVNDNWVQLANKREITFTNLTPGKYTLHVKGSNGDGIWNDEGAALRIIITPPWYWNWWSKTLYLMAAMTFLFFLYRFQLHRRLALAEADNFRELDQVKTKLYTNISHEFRTPLTVIGGTADQEIGHMGELSPEKILLNARMIKRNSNRLLRLVNHMLDLSKLESGAMPLNMVNGDLIAYLKYLIESFHSYAESKGIQLQLQSGPAELCMDYDPEKLLTILSNLLSNAIKFTPQDGEVFLSVEQEQNSAVIKVCDTGAGIPAEKLPLIFDRFYQADDGISRSADGTGIGLALTRELVKLLKGEISVKSTPGEGTEFAIRLPMDQKAPPDASAGREFLQSKEVAYIPVDGKAFPRVHYQTQSTSGLPLALIIEDNKDMVQYLADCLSQDFRLEITYNGEDGIHRALELIPDVIVSDVMMPGKDGFEVCRTLKKEERSSHIPIVLLTAKADLDSKLEGLQQGADAYLPKPFNRKELLIRLQNLLGLRKKLRRHYLSLAGQNVRGLPEKDESPDNKTDDRFVIKIREVVEKHLDDWDFNVRALCHEVAMSHSQLHRKLTALTGYSANRFIRLIRLSEARRLLLRTDHSISAIASSTGFNDPVYFTRVFREEFGMTPSKFRNG